jgi:hypothetical protein
MSDIVTANRGDRSRSLSASNDDRQVDLTFEKASSTFRKLIGSRLHSILSATTHLSDVLSTFCSRLEFVRKLVVMNEKKAMLLKKIQSDIEFMRAPMRSRGIGLSRNWTENRNSLSASKRRA